MVCFSQKEKKIHSAEGWEIFGIPTLKGCGVSLEIDGYPRIMGSAGKNGDMEDFPCSMSDGLG